MRIRRTSTWTRTPGRPSGRRRAGYLRRGFRVLEVELGHSLDDVERLHRLRDFTGDAMIRTEATTSPATWPKAVSSSKPV